MEEFTKILQRLRSGFTKYQMQNNGALPSLILMSYDAVNLVEAYAFSPTGCSAFEFSPARYRGVPIIAVSGGTDQLVPYIALGKANGI